MKNHSFFIFFILLGLTFLIIPTDKINLNNFHVDKHPQEYMRDIFIQKFTHVGNLSNQISANYWAYVPQISASTFSHPHLITYRPDGTEWLICADIGQAKQPKIGSIETIELSQNVKIERPPTSLAQPIKVETELLRYHLETESIESPVLVKMVQPNLTISGIGLRGFLNKNQVQLTQNVETHYKANTRTAAKAITIYSNRAEFDEKANKVTYRDNVIMTQGTHQIHSDKLIIEKNANGKIESMIATGSPAYFKSETQDNKIAKGQAKLVNYRPKENKIHLYQNAELTQNNHTIRSEQFSYDLNTEVLSSQPSQGQQTTIILQPQKNSMNL